MKFWKMAAAGAAAAIAAAIALGSCATTGGAGGGGAAETAAAAFGDGVYSYDFERVVENVQTEAFYRSSGGSYTQATEKVAAGLAVVVKGRSFKIPELGDWLEIGEDGSVSSPTNPTVSGRALGDGRVLWSGTFSEFDQTVQITERAYVLPSAAESRAPSSLNGTYKTEPGDFEFGFSLRDGVGESDNGGFIIVGKDGKFHSLYRIEMTQEMNGSTRRNIILDFSAEGSIDGDGALAYRVSLGTAGGAGTGGSTLTYKGSRVSRSVPVGEDYATGETPEPFRRDGDEPEWFRLGVEEKDGRLYACASQDAHDGGTARRIAVLTALAEIAAHRAISAEAAGGPGGPLKDSLAAEAAKSGEPAVENEFYNEPTGRGYVRVSVKK